MKSSLLKYATKEALWLTENLPIRLFGDPVLNMPCSKVTKKEIESGEAQKWAEQLIGFLEIYRKKTGAGRGLAANQIGISKRIILVWLEDGPKIYINPHVINSEGKGAYPESCISSASLIIGDVVRPWRIEVEYINLQGETANIKADPIHTRLLLHEIDHLKGIVCTDKYIKGTTRLAVGGIDEILKPELKQVN